MADYTRKIRLTYSKLNCNCGECNKNIKKGSSCFVDPKTKIAYCLNCGTSKPEYNESNM
jgi:hypothetical protein